MNELNLVVYNYSTYVMSGKEVGRIGCYVVCLLEYEYLYVVASVIV